MTMCRERFRYGAGEGESLKSICVLFVTLAAVSLSFLPVAAPASSTEGYGAQQFLAAYKNPDITYHEVRGDVFLTSGLPELSRALTLVGRQGPRGNRRPVIDGLKAADNGRGIITDSNLTLVNLEFRNFKSTVVSASGSYMVKIDRCVFRKNADGALDLYSSGFKISKSLFDRNSRKDDSGGAIYSMSDGYGSIVDTTFSNNYAGVRGGAIAFRTDIGTLINRCKFVGNKAAGPGGGALSLQRTLCTVENCKFQNNEAASPEGAGGAVRVFGNEEGIVHFCRGNKYSGNKAGKRGSNNVYVEIQGTEPAEVGCYFCPAKPAATLINATVGTVAVTCQYC